MNVAEWLTESLRGAIDDSAERMQQGLALLASVGSTAPLSACSAPSGVFTTRSSASVLLARPASAKWPAPSVKH